MWLGGWAAGLVGGWLPGLLGWLAGWSGGLVGRLAEQLAFREWGGRIATSTDCTDVSWLGMRELATGYYFTSHTSCIGRHLRQIAIGLAEGVKFHPKKPGM